MASDTGGGQFEDLARQEGSYRLHSTLATTSLCHHVFGSRVQCPGTWNGEGDRYNGLSCPARVLTPPPPPDGHMFVSCVPPTMK